ncbi:MAG: single-stranded DNA-binding protein [Solibacterales bacterium]|nr:single-stranded DNA-binding protein [Bryobacterales bacterium]
MSAWASSDVRSRVDEFLGPLLRAAQLDVGYTIDSAETLENRDLFSPDLLIEFSGPDVELLLLYRAELLLALEHLTLEALQISHQDRYRLIFDANGYRVTRIQELRLSAQVAAEKVKRTGSPFHFQPMSSRERRVLHLALRDEHEVRTVSEGIVPRRHTVIYSVQDKKED